MKPSSSHTLLLHQDRCFLQTPYWHLVLTEWVVLMSVDNKSLDCISPFFTPHRRHIFHGRAAGRWLDCGEITAFGMACYSTWEAVHYCAYGLDSNAERWEGQPGIVSTVLLSPLRFLHASAEWWHVIFARHTAKLFIPSSKIAKLERKRS